MPLWVFRCQSRRSRDNSTDGNDMTTVMLFLRRRQEVGELLANYGEGGKKNNKNHLKIWQISIAFANNDNTIICTGRRMIN